MALRAKSCCFHLRTQHLKSCRLLCWSVRLKTLQPFTQPITSRRFWRPRNEFQHRLAILKPHADAGLPTDVVRPIPRIKRPRHFQPWRFKLLNLHALKLSSQQRMALHSNSAKGRQNTAQPSQVASNTPSCWVASNQSPLCATTHRCSYAPVTAAPTNAQKRAAEATPATGVMTHPVWRQKVYLEPTFRP